MNEVVHPLHGNQMHAVDPAETVWLSASAGTGKTQVLASRVLRLLLQPGVEPSQILCLTFTKAGAAEMATRINETLAEWVRLEDTRLYQRLEAIGAPSGPEARAHARTLFASVLDCPGGGLRIDTIHAFSQWLLSAFPFEAGLMPGSRAMEDRDRALLARQVLSDLLVGAEQEPLGDPQLLAAISDLSLRMGPEAVEAWLLRCAAAREVWEGPGAFIEPMRPRINILLGLPDDADEAWIAGLCADTVFDVATLRRCHDTLADWNSATGRDGAAAIDAWLALDPSGRSDALAALAAALFTKDGKPRQLNNLLKRDPDYEAPIAAVAQSLWRVRDAAILLAMAERLVPALRLGRAFALAWSEAKEREGFIDFDDQIRLAAALLRSSDQSQWIGYKLDRRFDHILVDEAQDTNEAQWTIIDALSQEFFAGLGQRDNRLRTLFVVGDYKQAIFRFQGTSPDNFEAARRRVKSLLDGPDSPGLREYGLAKSFRTAQPVLDFVDQAITGIGHESFGLATPAERHIGDDRAGYVALWQPVRLPDDDGDEDGEGQQTWLSRPDRTMADRIAAQVRRWLDEGYPLVKPVPARNANAGDIMILVRKRRDLAALIVARLHAAGVPVAGVDRLRLGAPLAVKDLVAGLRFAAQPRDDLSLAALLVSPLGGWSQEDLLHHGYRERTVRLWDHLRRSRDPRVLETRDRLGQLLARADYDPPQVLLHWMLTGPWQGRRKLVARLGAEANDPIDELLNAAYAYATTSTPSIVGFLAWFDAGEGELKRDVDASAGLVRVMTVHGSKGLQAPIVILADATGNPKSSRPGGIDMPDPHNPRRMVPLPGLRQAERVGRIAEEHERVEREEMHEHWRLLYVAMTRAEEALFIGGALGAREQEPAPESWYARLHALFATDAAVQDEVWGSRLDFGAPPAPGAVKVASRSQSQPSPPGSPPAWLERPPPAEPAPPRPLSPSSLGEDLSASPPFPAGAGEFAARRGVLIHRLLERLPDVHDEARRAVALTWLARQAPTMPQADRAALADAALSVIDRAEWADLFAPGSLAEVPVVATLGGRVVAGTIDRLLVRSDSILIVDYKTTMRPPESIESVPVAILRQMAAYAAALDATWPGRKVRAALLYTAAPRLIVIPDDVLEVNKQALLSPM